MIQDQNYWRPAYEVYALWGWTGAAAVAGYVVYEKVLPTGAFIIVISVAIVRGAQRLAAGLAIWRHRLMLAGRAARVIPSRVVAEKISARPNHVWLGWGFQWTRIHMQRLYELETLDLDRLRVPILSRLHRDRPMKGNPLLHGVEAREVDIYVDRRELEGHVFVPAATGAIKTRLLALFAIQAIRRSPKESVVVIDPKGDSALRELIRAEAVNAGRGEDFAYFNPAFPRESVRIDPLFNWVRTTGIASRIAALIPSESGHDPWSAFGWRVLNLVGEGCVHTFGERPTLTTVRRYVEGGIDPLLHATLVQTFESKGVDWRAGIEPHLKQVRKYKRPSATTPDETVGLVAFYKADAQQKRSIGLIDGLISMFEHDREHAQKMLASLIPVLTMLTAGDLAGLLSPDRDDPSDRRPILDGAKIADSGAILYVGLDQLSDPVVGSAIASIFLADLTAHAGARFNADVSEPRVNVFVDEAAEAVNPPFIQLLNKARSAGFSVVFFAQTVSDFEAALGRGALARQVLGNANSVIAGRTKDQVTADYAMENFGTSVLRHRQAHETISPTGDGHLLNYATAYGDRHGEVQSEIVPADALSKLPDLEYFATFSGSGIVKGRIPVVQPDPR